MVTRYDKSWCPYRYRCPETRQGPYRMGVLASPTILQREMLVPTILFVLGWLQSTVSCRVWSLVQWF